MNSSPLLAVLLLVASALAADNSTMQKVNVTVFYESLCPDSRDFITNQLYPAWQKYMDKIELELVPYGKAETKMENNVTTFTCHHGEPECVGNKIQACILDGQTVPKLEDRVKIISCLMKNATKDAAYPTKACVSEVPSLDATQVSEALEKCANSTLGDDKLKMLGERTKQFEASGLTNVPTVTINGVKDQDAVTKFESTLCSKLTGANKPATCPKGNGNGASTLAAITLLPLVAAIATFTL